jgi:hypothetical protein
VVPHKIKQAYRQGHNSQARIKTSKTITGIGNINQLGFLPVKSQGAANIRKERAMSQRCGYGGWAELLLRCTPINLPSFSISKFLVQVTILISMMVRSQRVREKSNQRR